MPDSPIALFLVLAAIMLVTALAAFHVGTRFLGMRLNKWTCIAWAMLAAVVAYFVVQGLRHP